VIGQQPTEVDLLLDEASSGSEESSGVKLFIDPDSRPLLDGMQIGFIESLQGSGFTFDNPNATLRERDRHPFKREQKQRQNLEYQVRFPPRP